MQITPLKIIAGTVAIVTLLLTFVIQRIPIPEEVKAQPALSEQTLLEKADKIRVINIAKVVTPERIMPDIPAKAPPVIVMEEPGNAETNICTRHNMHKVYTRNGRSWRCRR